MQVLTYISTLIFWIYIYLQLRHEFSLCRVYKKSKCLRSFDRRPPPALPPPQPSATRQVPSAVAGTSQQNPQMEDQRMESSPESSSSGEQGNTPSHLAGQTSDSKVIGDEELFLDLDEFWDLWSNQYFFEFKKLEPSLHLYVCVFFLKKSHLLLSSGGTIIYGFHVFLLFFFFLAVPVFLLIIEPELLFVLCSSTCVSSVWEYYYDLGGRCSNLLTAATEDYCETRKAFQRQEVIATKDFS